ncbi:MAG TPA: hypothetical protein VKS22_03710 [Candidatus Binataceae bacterium]|nr:hypothetical protein [Candidatus Binataceae bacterium]
MVSMVSRICSAKRLLVGGFALSVAFMLAVRGAQAQPVAASPYTLTTFPGVPPNQGTPPSPATKPDDLAISADGADLWVAYQNNAAPDGTSGTSNIVEYEISTGKVLQNVIIAGHTDGLKINPKTNEVWTTQNEDASPTLAEINPKNGKFKTFGFVNPTAHGGGFDDFVFAGKNSQDVFISASNPAGPPFTSQAIVQISGKPAKVTKVTQTLAGNATAFNVVTGADETLAISDADSMTLDPAGELVLDSQGDDELIVVRSATATNPVLNVPLTMSGVPTEVNDTIFVGSTSGMISTAGTLFITDTGGNAIYTLTKPYFPPSEVYTVADAVGDIGLLDMNTGIITPVVTGLVHPNGIAFSPAAVALVTLPIPKK